MVNPSPNQVELPFLAPIPVGHEVLVVALRQSPEARRTQFLVLDQTVSVLYCDDRLWGPLSGNVQATIDPVGLLTRFSWVVDRQFAGRVCGAMVGMATAEECNTLRTRIFLQAASDTPYR